MKNTYSFEIDAPPERVFACIYDAEHLKQWLPNLVENEVLAAEERGVGSRFRQVYLENGRRMEMTGVVVGFERNRYLACEIRGPMFDLDVEYRLEDLGGRTRLTQDSQVLFNNVAMKILTKLLAPVIKKASRKQLDSGFAKLKTLAESRAA
jgi:uncharacterized protein YndB with AHSA1/START domain